MFDIIASVASYINRLLKCDPSQHSRSAYYNNDDNYVPLRSPLVTDSLLSVPQPLPGCEFGGSNWSSRWTSGFGGTTRR
ncbi:hypothetical protein OS493_034085 [Desmophyllum pertusum]|uniref:Uncharacterized protein n=1 Tax=Desmophyllum pertusum TaxID=174260 RepID=A0A9W9YK77_9CNID|nr:hypothetical protein OS493_034085 [Desmophyllum pertusum]